MAGKKHVHKYHKVEVAGTLVWACALAECSHYMPDHLKQLMPGKMSKCWLCDDAFPLDDRALKMTQPICINCAFPTSGAMDEILNGGRGDFPRVKIPHPIDDVNDPDDL